VLDAAPDAIVIVDEAGCIVLVNAQAERLFAYARGDLVGRPVETLLPEQYREIHGRHRAEYAARPRTRGMGTDIDLRALRRDGTEFPAEVSLSPLRTPSGLLVMAAIRDVTDRRKIETALRATNEELEAFSHSVAHDLRAPIRAMRGSAEVLLERHAEELTPEARDWLLEIRNAALGLGKLVDALLSLSRVSRAPFEPEKLDLASLAASVITELRAAQPERWVDVTLGDPMFVFADPALVRALLDNLLRNAWKFSSQRNPACIEVGRVRASDSDAFFVRDNGAGFDMELAEHLFTPFRRLHRADEYPGTGIGLATARRIVHRHGGRIWAEAAPGAGATFYFTLPSAPS
jgi:PAS domain S-box-containing protein